MSLSIVLKVFVLGQNHFQNDVLLVGRIGFQVEAVLEVVVNEIQVEIVLELVVSGAVVAAVGTILADLLAAFFVVISAMKKLKAEIVY